MTQIAPEMMRTHLQMNQSRLLTSDDVAEEIESYMDAQEENEQAATGTVGAIKGKKGKGDEKKGVKKDQFEKKGKNKGKHK